MEITLSVLSFACITFQKEKKKLFNKHAKVIKNSKVIKKKFLPQVIYIEIYMYFEIWHYSIYCIIIQEPIKLCIVQNKRPVEDYNFYNNYLGRLVSIMIHPFIHFICIMLNTTQKCLSQNSYLYLVTTTMNNNPVQVQRKSVGHWQER